MHRRSPVLFRAITLLGLSTGCGDPAGPPQHPAQLEVITVGQSHSCGLSAMGQAYCWGSGLLGALGDGTDTSRDSPVLVDGGLTFISLSAGPNHTCGIAIDGGAYCWGFGPEGSLGAPMALSRVPIAVEGGLTFAQVISGGGHSCGLAGAGVAHCWGAGGVGQLGTGQYASDTTPALVAGGLAFLALAAGGGHTCGLASDGATYCWGSNQFGQLGIDNTTPAESLPSLVSGGLRFREISAGVRHTCGIAVTGVAYCWGEGLWGQLGNGARQDQFAPATVGGGLLFRTISAGYRHTCGIATNGRAYCWGVGDAGQLGTGTWIVGDSLPVPVAGGHSFRTISAGDVHTCGTTVDGAAYCWGYGGTGQLGSTPTGLCGQFSQFPCSPSPQPVQRLP